MSRLINALVAILIIGSNTSLCAQESNDCVSEPYRQFDFWLGEWKVTTPDGEIAGANRIESEQNGCIIGEYWTGAEGNTGTSINYYSPETDKWRQEWVSPGIRIDISGSWENGSMTLVGTIYYEEQDATRGFKGIWTPKADGTVRQYFEEQNDQGVWAPWFEGLYTQQ